MRTPTPTKRTPTPTVTPTPTPTGAPTPTRRYKMPPGIMGRTPTEGEKSKQFKKLVESFIPAGAEKSWVGISKEKQYAVAKQNIIAVAAASKRIQRQHGLTDIQAVRYMIDLAKWKKRPSWIKGVAAPSPGMYKGK